MKTFYKTGVDICSVKSMWHFLKDHFTYSTLNSWNRMDSIAHNVKVYNLGLEGDWTVALHYLMDEADSGNLQLWIDDEIRNFEEEHPYYRVGFNGRSNGYLVLYNKDNYQSILPDCITDYDTYEDFKQGLKDSWYEEYLKDYLKDLREATQIVREFDKLCDRLCELVNAYSMRSFDTDKLEAAVERFNEDYYSDLEKLELKGPEMEECMTGGRVKLNDISEYTAFMECFTKILGVEHYRIASDSEGKYLWLKEE